MKTVIVTGPRGSGKNRVAEGLRFRFGCATIVEDWWPGMAVVPGALHLTHEPISEPTFRGVPVYQFKDVRP